MSFARPFMGETSPYQRLVAPGGACYIRGYMRLLSAIAILLAMAATGAESPAAPDAWAPDARLFYESDTRAYYRPCG